MSARNRHYSIDGPVPSKLGRRVARTIRKLDFHTELQHLALFFFMAGVTLQPNREARRGRLTHRGQRYLST